MSAKQLQALQESYPLQVSVHDWTIPGTPVHTATQGYLCPELETPAPGQSVIYVDYDLLPGDTLIQAHVELAIDALGYPAGSRWIGRSALDADNVVSYVGTFPTETVPQHLTALQHVVPLAVLTTLNG